MSAKYGLFCGDAVKFLGKLQTESIDLITTDVAYESLEKHRAIGTTTRLAQSDASSNQWFPIFPNARFPELFAECFRVLRPDRHFYFFCDQETMFVAKPIGEAAGFKFWKPIVWDKVLMGMGYHYRAQCEFILFFEKRKKGRQLVDRGVTDIVPPSDWIVERRVAGYPTEKPVGVNRVLIQQSSALGELVLDPFMGSGSAGIAAAELGRRFLGNDITDHAVKLASDSLSKILGTPDLVVPWSLGSAP